MECGDRIIVEAITNKKQMFKYLNGLKGKVIVKAPDWENYWGIEFEVPVDGGHGCGGTGKLGYCKYVKINYLKKVNTKEGGENLDSRVDFKPGDLLECISHISDFTVGRQYEVVAYGKEIGPGWDSIPSDIGTLTIVNHKNVKPFFKLVSNKGENVMKKVIRENFEKTEDACLVEKHLGGLMNDHFMDGLVVKANKEAILKEARRLEEIELKKKCK